MLGREVVAGGGELVSSRECWRPQVGGGVLRFGRLTRLCGRLGGGLIVRGGGDGLGSRRGGVVISSRWWFGLIAFTSGAPRNPVCGRGLVSVVGWSGYRVGRWSWSGSGRDVVCYGGGGLDGGYGEQCVECGRLELVEGRSLCGSFDVAVWWPESAVGVWAKRGA